MFSKQLFDMYNTVPTEVMSTGGSSAIETTTQGTGAMTAGNDIISPAGYGARVLTFPEDTLQPDIALNNKDTVFAMTDTSNRSTQSSGNADIMQMAAAIVSAIQQQTRALKQDTVFGQGMNASYFS
jgi:hypothetical protein